MEALRASQDLGAPPRSATTAAPVRRSAATPSLHTVLRLTCREGGRKGDTGVMHCRHHAPTST